MDTSERFCCGLSLLCLQETIMKYDSTLPWYHQIIVCLLAGLTSGASFNRLAARLLGPWMPEVLITPLTLLIMLSPIVYAAIWHLKRNEGESMVILDFWQGVIRFAIAFDLAMFGWFKKNISLSILGTDGNA